MLNSNDFFLFSQFFPKLLTRRFNRNGDHEEIKPGNKKSMMLSKFFINAYLPLLFISEHNSIISVYAGENIRRLQFLLYSIREQTGWKRIPTLWQTLLSPRRDVTGTFPPVFSHRSFPPVFYTLVFSTSVFSPPVFSLLGLFPLGLFHPGLLHPGPFPLDLFPTR